MLSWQVDVLVFGLRIGHVQASMYSSLERV